MFHVPSGREARVSSLRPEIRSNGADQTYTRAYQPCAHNYRSFLHWDSVEKASMHLSRTTLQHASYLPKRDELLAAQPTYMWLIEGKTALLQQHRQGSAIFSRVAYHGSSLSRLKYLRTTFAPNNYVAFAEQQAAQQGADV